MKSWYSSNRNGKIGWLDFVLKGENSDDFKQWCKDHGTKQCEDAAEFYVDMTDRNMSDHQILTTTMKNGTENSAKSQSEKAAELFTEMMIDRMEVMKSGGWEKGWIAGNDVGGLPQNVTGRNYSGSNSFFLELNTAMKGYKTPVYLTFMQAQDLKAHILKGGKVNACTLLGCFGTRPERTKSGLQRFQTNVQRHAV